MLHLSLSLPRPGHSGIVARRTLRGVAAPALLSVLLGGCAVRTMPPISWVPLIGAEKKTSTTDVLVRAMRDRDVAVRAQAVALLGLVSEAGDKGIKREVAAILGMALRDRDPGLRLQAVEQLGQMAGEFSNKYLQRALRDPNPFVRAKVLDVVGERERQARAAREQETTQAAAGVAAAASGP